jgi:hypothetical protein
MRVKGKLPKLTISGLEEKKRKKMFTFERDNSNKDTFKKQAWELVCARVRVFECVRVCARVCSCVSVCLSIYERNNSRK